MKRFRLLAPLSRVGRFFDTWTVSSHVLCLLAIGGFIFSACQSTPPWQRNQPPPLPPMDGPYEAPLVNPPGLALSTEQRFKDVPVPRGAKSDADRSFVYQSPSLHLGRMVYSTRASMADLAQFYIREAPTGQWQLTNTIEAQKRVKLQFSKPGHRMDVEVHDLGFAQGRRLTVTVTPDGGGGGL